MAQSSMKYLIRLKIQDFSLKELFIKSNRTAIQTYKGEEGTLGTSCRCSIMFDYRTQSNDWCSIFSVIKTSRVQVQSVSLITPVFTPTAFLLVFAFFDVLD